MIVAILLLVLLTLDFRCQIAQNYYPKSESNEATNYYVDKNGSDTNFCGEIKQQPCSTLDILLKMIRNGEYYIHVYEGTYLLTLSSFRYYLYNIYPIVDIIAEQEAQINITGPVHSISLILLSFSKFSIDFCDQNFLIDDDGSLLKFTDSILFRNAGNTAINSNPLVIVSHGSLILENLNIHGNNLEGNEPLIQATSPKLIQFASLTVTNLSLVSGNTAPLLLSVTELPQESKIVISDIHAKQNTVGNQAETGIIFIHATSPMNNEDSSAQPILLVENSEITQNTLAPIQDACSIQLEGLKPEQILIKNSFINNRSPTNNDKQYELKIALPKDCEPKDLITQFQTVDFGATIDPVAVKLLPNEQFNALVLPLSDEYANITVNNNGQESCSSYIANYYQDVKSVGCAVIIMRAQDNLGLFRGIQRLISITGNLTENDLHTDGLTVSFKGTNTQTSANMISFKPNLPISYNPIDNVLFRIRDGGKVTLTDLYIQRSNITGSENAPIIMIISGFVQQSNAIGNNSPVQLVIDRCILEGGNFASSNVWYNLGLAETCNVGYGAAIVADGQTTVQISGSTIRTFEGPAVRALNGASVTIDKNTFLDNNGQRNRNTLSSMQTNVVCEGGNGVTTVNIALDNVASVTSTGNGWIFSSSDNSCIVKATFNDQPALPRSLPQTNSAQITVNNTNQLAEVVIRGKFLEPCMRRLILEIHEKNKVDVGVIFEFDVESSSFTVNWIDSENINFQFPSSLLQDLNSSIKWEIGIYESGKREQTNWLSIEPEQIRPDEDEEKQKKTNPVVGIVVPIVVVIIVAIIIIVVIALYVRNKNLGQQSKQFRSESNANMSDIEVTSNNEIAKDEQQEQNAQNQQKHKELTQVSTPFFKESDTEQKVSSDPIISRDYEPNKKQDQIKQQLERQNDIKQESSSKNSHRSKLHQSIRSDTYLTKKDREIQKYELNKKTKEQIQKSKDSRKSSKPRNGSSYRQKNRFNNEKRRQQINFNSEKKRRKSLSLESSTNTTSSNDSSDSDSTSFTLHSSDTDDQKQSSSSIQTQDANELKVMEVLQKKKEMKNKDQQKQQSDNKKTYKQKGQIKEKNMKKKEGDSQKYEDKIAEEDILYQEGDSSPQPSDIDKSSSSTLTSSDSEDKDHKKKSSLKNKKNTKEAKQKPNSSKKEKPKTKTQKGNHLKSKNRNSKPTEPTEPTESNNNPQLNDINNQLDSDSAFPPPVTILDFDESKLVIQRDANNQPVDIKPSQIYTQTSSIEKSLNQSSDSRPPLLERLVVDFQGNSKHEVV